MTRSVILIGMPGCGKSTTGVLLAKAICAEFCDTDLVIQKREGKSLCEIIAERGTDGFLDAERDTIMSLDVQRTVIATGGSVVCRGDAMEHLRRLGTIVYLDVPLGEIIARIDNITTRGIALSPGQTLADVYAVRRPLYEKYADITVSACGSAERTVGDIIDKLHNYTY
ncbi:MAG: shikimate kinase [Eubacteriales bacterium]